MVREAARQGTRIEVHKVGPKDQAAHLDTPPAQPEFNVRILADAGSFIPSYWADRDLRIKSSSGWLL
jgi:hypothetical protein